MNCKSILVVEDNEDIRDSVAELLRMEGFSVDTAVDGKDALEKLPMLTEPLVLLDMMMPVMNGWEFLEARKGDPRLADLPVVVVSAVPAGKALVPDTGLVHAEGLLEKPINIRNLLKVVQTYCEPAVIMPHMGQNLDPAAP
jgi:two-component system chemotaxis response regulator CheY